MFKSPSFPALFSSRPPILGNVPLLSSTGAANALTFVGASVGWADDDAHGGGVGETFYTAGGRAVKQLDSARSVSMLSKSSETGFAIFSSLLQDGWENIGHKALLKC